ncbi:MAG: hypothetical protein AAFV51_07500 [Pseudomonadota bacterium]
MLLAAIAIALFCMFAERSFPLLSQRAASSPALVLLIASAAGIAAARFGGLEADAAAVAALATTLLSGLAFAAGLQVKLGRLPKACPTSFRLATIGAPIFLVGAAAAAFALLPGLSSWSAVALAAALVLNGAATDRTVFMRAPAPNAMKFAVRTESAATLVLGAPAAIVLASAAGVPDAGARPAAALELTIASVLLGLILGAFIGAAAAIPARIAARSGRERLSRAFAVAGGATAFAAATFSIANPICAAAAAGLALAHDGRLAAPSRVALRRIADRGVSPVAFALFGFVLAPQILAEADLLILLFAVFVVGGVRIIAREAALARAPIDAESRRFVSWFGGAPGAASALFLLTYVDAGRMSDQEMVLTAGATAVFAGVLITRLTSKPIARRYVRALAAARRRFADPAGATAFGMGR